MLHSELTGDEELYARWLSEIATPVDWHAATLGWNCDHGFVPFFWIVRQPDCEKATALSLFYRFEPLRLLMQDVRRSDLDIEEVEVLELVKEIRARFVAGYYTRATLAFDGLEAFREEFGTQDMTPAVEAAVPAEMRVKIEGDILSSDGMEYADGFPNAMWQGT